MKKPGNTTRNLQKQTISYHRIATGFLLLALLLSHTAIAQETNTDQQGQGRTAPSITYKEADLFSYLFAARGKQALRGQDRRATHVGAGFEFIYPTYDAGLALELGISYPTEFTGKPSGVLSFNAPKRFFTNERVQPFITGGYSLYFGEVAKSRWNYGGGVLIWVRDTWGLRLEARDHVPITSPTRAHSWQFRAGLTFPVWD